MSSPSQAAVDPVTVEILANRFWVTNDEVAATVRRVSGSPVATEACDFNTALMDANGDSLTIGMYMLLISTGLDFIVKDVLENLADNPGIGPGDMFLCSDPYRGVLHQSDVALVAPVHWEGELIAWSGVAIHQVDVGGLVYGSHGSIGAKSIYHEGLPIPPIRIVEGGRLRKDIEAEYLIRSRTRELNALDLRAKIAANNLARERILDCVERYGADTVRAAMRAIVDSNEERLRGRLAQLPDGVWRHRAYMDGEPGETVYMEMEMSKTGSDLVFDLTKCAPQADAVFNCGRPGAIGGVIAAVLPMLCFGTQWCPAAVRRVVEVRTRPGTIVDPEWPAGMCKASTSSIPMINTMATACLGKMLAAGEADELTSRAMAPWMVAATVQDLFGTDRHGRPFAATMLDPMAGGGGARATTDGIDSGGIIRAVKLRIANVETYEFRYPMLYLHRRQEPDSGGAGEQRGGVGCSLMYTPHGVDEIPGNVMHSINTRAPVSVGILGGFPAGTNTMVMRRGTNVWEEIAAGRLPQEFDDLDGDVVVVPGMLSSTLGRGDVYRSLTCGGGGFGDPLSRAPEAVAADVRRRTATRGCAEAAYGVVLLADGTVDEEATAGRRHAMLDERLAAARAPADPPAVEAAREIATMGGALRVFEAGGEHFTGCTCGCLWAPVDRNYKTGLAVLETPIQAASPYANPFAVGEPFAFRRFICPSCRRVVEIEVAWPGDEPLLDIQLAGFGPAGTKPTHPGGDR